MLTFSSAPNYVRTRRKTTARSKSQPSSSDAKTPFWLFTNPQIPPRSLPVHDVIHIPPGLISIWDFYFDFSEWHILPARAWTPALMLHLTNPWTKPKGKIYKTKSSAIILHKVNEYN